MLGAEDTYKFNAGCIMQQADGALTVAAQTCVIGDQGDAGPCERAEFVAREHVDAGQYVACK